MSSLNSSRSVQLFLKELDVRLHSEYIMERYKTGENKFSNYQEPEFKFETPKFQKIDLNIPCVKDLEDEHFCKQYVKSRNIEVTKYKYLYFAQDFKLMKDLIDTKYNVGILNKVLYKLNMENNISNLNADEQKYFADCARKGIVPIDRN